MVGAGDDGGTPIDNGGADCYCTCSKLQLLLHALSGLSDQVVLCLG